MNRILATALLALAPYAAAQEAKPIVLAYVRGTHHLITPDEIAAQKLTRIHYAFLVPHDGIITASDPTDDTNLHTLVALKKQNPALEVLVSVGGGANSSGFSDLAQTSESRGKFVASCIDLIAQYKLDGIDIDWEYPGSPFPGHTSRPEEDKVNYTLLFRDLRKAFTLYEEKTHSKHLLLSTATNGKPFFIRSTDLAAASVYLDTIALMGYDVYGPNSPTTGNHSPLFTDSADPIQYSDDSFLQAYASAGVPTSKIVLGVPFYGYGWRDVPAIDNGLFQLVAKHATFDIPYNSIVQQELATGSGFTRFWDNEAKVPILYNNTTHVFISYEDPESIAFKAEYVRKHHLAGMMFWEYSGDLNNQLLDAINAGLNSSLAKPLQKLHTRKP
jgi:chitinase